MNFFVIFTVFMLLSSYCMVMWNHSSNFMDSVILKQQYEQKYYLCQALLDYGIGFYKTEYLLLKKNDSKVFNNWPDINYNKDNKSAFLGKISWENINKKVIIKAELINKSNNKIEFSLQETLNIDSNQDNGPSSFVLSDFQVLKN